MLMGKDLLVGVSLLLALFFRMNQQCLRTALVYSSKSLLQQEKKWEDSHFAQPQVARRAKYMDVLSDGFSA